jgi:uncharacterized membrane protein
MYFDGPQYYRSCYCPWCRQSFKEFSGLDLPPIRESRPGEGMLTFHPNLAPGLDWEDPAIHAYFDWVAKMDLELLASLYATIKGIRDIPLLAHGSSIMHRTFKAPFLQHALQVEGCLFESGVDFMHRYVVAQLTASVDRAMWSYTGSLAVHPRVFENAREYTAEAYAAIAAGGTPILSFGNRVYFDDRGDDVVREVFDFLKDHEEDLSGLKSVPYAAVPYSEHTGQWFGRERPEERYNQVYRSFVACLNEGHVQTNPVLEDKLESAEALRHYDVVCLPQMVCMSDREAEALREYVDGGGGLVVTGLTGTRNERGLERPNFALADVLGVHYEGYSAETYDRYLRIDAGHEVTEGLTVGQLLPQAERTVVRAGEKTSVIGTSMEYAEASGPALVLHSYGKGRTAYFASNMATMYARPPEKPSRLFDRYPPIRVLLARAVEWAARRPNPIQVEAHPTLTATLMAKPGILALHLVNYAGPRHDKAHTVTEAFLPISDVPVAVRIPEGAEIAGVRTWRAGQDLKYRIEDGWLKVAVPQIEEYEAVAISLAKE